MEFDSIFDNFRVKLEDVKAEMTQNVTSILDTRQSISQKQYVECQEYIWSLHSDIDSFKNDKFELRSEVAAELQATTKVMQSMGEKY